MLTFSLGAFSLSGFGVRDALMEGNPSVAVARPREEGFNITTWMLQPEHLETVVVRVKEELQKARV